MGLFSKKEKRAFEVMNEKNKEYLDSMAEVSDNYKNSREDEVYPEGTFEKGDLPAMIIAALGMMVPIAAIILVLIIGIAVLLTGMY